MPRRLWEVVKGDVGDCTCDNGEVAEGVVLVVDGRLRSSGADGRLTNLGESLRLWAVLPVAVFCLPRRESGFDGGGGPLEDLLCGWGGRAVGSRADCLGNSTSSSLNVMRSSGSASGNFAVLIDRVGRVDRMLVEGLVDLDWALPSRPCSEEA